MMYAVYVSALLYSLSFIIPELFFWCTLPALALLFVAIERNSSQYWWHGALWGGVVYGLQGGYVIFSLSSMMGNSVLIVSTCWALMTLYFCLYTLAWYAALRYVRINIFQPSRRIIFYFVFSLLFFWWLSRGMFFIFDYFEGWLVGDLVVPWGCTALGVAWARLVGLDLLRVILLFLAAMLAWCILRFSRLSNFSFLFFIVLLFTVPQFLSRSSVYPSCSAGVFHAGFIESAPVHSDQHGRRLCSALHTLRDHAPLLEIVVSPESAFPLCLSEHPSVCATLRSAAGDSTIFLSSHRRNANGGAYSTMFFLPSTIVVGSAGGTLNAEMYDKCHLIFCSERMPSLVSFFGGLLGLNGALKNFVDEMFVCGKEKNKEFILPNGKKIIPCICSDLFFTDTCGAHEHARAEGAVIVAQINDAWFLGTPLPKLLWLTARLKAGMYDMPIVYASYTQANVAFPDGTISVLPCCSCES